jgi:hypothetical protein
VNSKTTKPDDLPNVLQLFQKGFSELEKNKSISETQRTASLERSIEMFSWLLYLTLENSIKTRNWYVGILLSSSFLEDVGIRRLKLKFKGKINPDKIERLSLEQITMLLLASGTIDYKVYQKLMDVKEARNDLVHGPFKAMSLFAQTGFLDNKESQDARSNIKKAISCLWALAPHRREKKGTAHLKKGKD